MIACLATIIVDIVLECFFLFLYHASDSAKDHSGHFSL